MLCHLIPLWTPFSVRASAHIGRVAMDYLNAVDILLLNWPANNSDLNPFQINFI